MASGEYFIRMGKSIAGPAKREKIEALWNAGKLAETAEVSPDKIHWETVKEFLEGKLPDSVDIQQEDGEPDEFEEEVVKPKRSKNLLGKRALQVPPGISLPQGRDILTHQKQSPGAFLEAIRKRSAYSGLRTTIEVSTALSLICVEITGVAFFIMGLKAENELLVLLGVVVAVLGFFLILASRQASLLLIDIADTLIEQNRKKGRNLSDKNQKKEKPPLGLIKFFFP